jgi:hypothetical protein
MTNILINRWRRFLPVLALALFAVGCGNGRKPVHVVKGRVLVGDRPAAKALVSFHPVGDNSPDANRPSAETDDDGWFQLTTYTRGDGAPEGDYQVAVSWFRAVKNGKDDFQTVNYLPDRYGKAETSKLTAAVRSGVNELPPFHLQPR